MSHTSVAVLEFQNFDVGIAKHSDTFVARIEHSKNQCFSPKTRPQLRPLIVYSSFATLFPRKMLHENNGMNSLSLPIMEPDSDQSTSKSKSLSANDMSITELYPR
ncbi:hypothetical protein NC653_027054 [Populus alba x Populus x berolinensis]|uniref:Uncharacterized protein n=2 Tax=Populus alba x Populus x berolinensis TaxID=444605 RepID=A0AAD6M4H2_9ROSI|nr:hypothetical protein NC653_027054 [Populus alba x Populus x berolinensis]